MPPWGVPRQKMIWLYLPTGIGKRRKTSLTDCRWCIQYKKRLHSVCSRFLMGIENIGPVPLSGKWGADECGAIFPGRKS